MRFRTYAPALLCVGITAVSMLLIWPVVESGMVDDWSIARTAQVLAQTGHIHYNGWEAPILGWPLYIGALFVRLFGFSFTALRVSTMLEACVTVFLMQRILVRAGVNTWNSVFGTLTLAFCPVFATASVLFMTDLPGLLAVLICFYACLRGSQASLEKSAAAWICFAAISNGILGTTRQIAWLGLLVMVPSAVWLLKKSRLVVIAGATAWLVSTGFIVGVLLWFSHQPYVLPEHILFGRLHLEALAALVRTPFHISLELILLLLPVAVAFVPFFGAGAQVRRRLVWATPLLLPWLMVIVRRQTSTTLIAPFLLYDLPYQSPETLFSSFPTPILGPSPGHISYTFRWALTVLTLFALFALFAAVLVRRSAAQAIDTQPGRISWHDLLILIVPFSAAYLLLLMPRAVFVFTVDRYLIFLLPFAILLLLRLYTDIGRNKVPAFAMLLLVLETGFTVLTLHDLFATYRANLAAIEQIEKAGVPRTAINGGAEYNLMSQALADGYAHAGGIRLPDGSILKTTNLKPGTDCSQAEIEFTPAVHPVYAIAYLHTRCSLVQGFQPIVFHAWLPPFERKAQVIRYGLPGPHDSKPNSSP